MCFGGQPKTPKVPKPQPRPKTDEESTIAGEARRKADKQQGVFANIFTSALGDSGYGKSVKKGGGLKLGE